MTEAVFFLVGFIIGGVFLFQVGFYWARLFELVRNLQLPKTSAGPTYGAYHPVNENASTKEESLIVEPKTPQLIEWEAARALEKENLAVKPK